MDGSARAPTGARGAAPRHPRQAALEAAGATLLRAGEAAVVVVGLFLFTRALSSLLSGGNTDPNGENAVLRTVYTSVYVLIFPAVCFHWRRVLAAALRHGWTLALVALSVASVAWSADPGTSQRRAAAWALTTLFGVYLAGRYDTRTLLKLTAAALGSAGVLSALVAVGLPAVGVESEIHAGAWKGIFPQKNNLAQTMVLSTVVFLLLRPTLARGRWVATVGAVFSLGVVLMTTSKTAMVVLLILGVLTVLFRALRWRYTVAVPFLISCVLIGGSAGLWLLSNAEDLLVAMGKDATLTGRTPMWTILAEMISRRPWLGYGYAAFWLDGPNSPAAEVQSFLQWETPNAHNGFLDLALQLGGIGLAVFGIGLAVAFARALATLRRSHAPEALWPVLYLSYLLLYNVTESAIIVRHNIFWVLYVATACSLARAVPRDRAEPARHAGRPAPAPAGRVHARR